MATARKRKSADDDHTTAPRPKKQRPEPADRFTSLPGELRNRIYELVLFKHTHDHPLVLTRPARKIPIKFWRRTKFRGPGLFLASKQIRRDSMSIYFEINRINIQVDSRNLNDCLVAFRLIIETCGKLPLDNLSVRFSFKHWADVLSTMVTILRYVFECPRGSTVQWTGMFTGFWGLIVLRKTFEKALAITLVAKSRGDTKAQFRAALRGWAEEIKNDCYRFGMVRKELWHCMDSRFEQDFIKPPEEVPDHMLS